MNIRPNCPKTCYNRCHLCIPCSILAYQLNSTLRTTQSKQATRTRDKKDLNFLGHEERQKYFKALRNRQDLFQEEGILSLILDAIDKMNTITGQGILSSLAGEESGQQWNDVAGYLFQILGTSSPHLAQWSCLGDPLRLKTPSFSLSYSAPLFPLE